MVVLRVLVILEIAPVHALLLRVMQATVLGILNFVVLFLLRKIPRRWDGKAYLATLRWSKQQLLQRRPRAKTARAERRFKESWGSFGHPPVVVVFNNPSRCVMSSSEAEGSRDFVFDGEHAVVPVDVYDVLFMCVRVPNRDVQAVRFDVAELSTSAVAALCGDAPDSEITPCRRFLRGNHL